MEQYYTDSILIILVAIYDNSGWKLVCLQLGVYTSTYKMLLCMALNPLAVVVLLLVV